MGSDYLFSLIVMKPPIFAMGRGESRPPRQRSHGKRNEPHKHNKVKAFYLCTYSIKGKIEKTWDVQYTINVLNIRFRGRRLLSTKGSRYDLKRQAKRTGIPLIKDEMRGNLLDYVFRSQKKFDREPIDTATRRYMQKIRKRLRSIHNEKRSVTSK